MNTSAENDIRHEIWNLPPADSYEVYIDETHPPKGVNSTLFVAVVFDSDKSTKSLEIEHATAEKPETLNAKLKDLTAQPIGILGVSLEDSKGNVRWLSSVYRTAEIVCYLLMQKNPSCKKINFFVEEYSQIEAGRSPNSPGANAKNFNAINPKENQKALNQQAKIFRGTYAELLKRAPKIAPECLPKISFEIISKQLAHTPQIQKIRLVYADIIANAWGGSTRETLHNTPEWKKLTLCFFEKESTELLERTIRQGHKEITPAEWSSFLLSSEYSYEYFLLGKLSDYIEEHPESWNEYMEFTSDYLNSKAIRMELLEKQVKWLSDNKPHGVELPKVLQFMLLQAQIAESNHKGEILPKNLKNEFDKTAKILKREHVRLVAETTLHIATSYTNAFEFKEAKSCLQKLKTIPPIALGLQLQGRLHSALGQCEAFLGNHKEAIKLFDEAIKLFKQQSDTQSAAKDIDQTLSYKIIARMDSCNAKTNDRKRLQVEVAEYLGCPWDKLPQIARCIATRKNERMFAEKYHHHILLRYIASGHASEDVSTAYQRVSKKWNHGEDFHPWELIEFYRAILFDTPENVSRANQICSANGITLRIINLVIMGATNPQAFKKRFLAENAKLMPTFKILSREAYSALCKWRDRNNDTPPTREERLKFFSAVLPFNFR